MEGATANLGGHELGSAAERARSRSVPHLFFAQTVISDLDVAVEGEKDVVELQVAVMHDKALIRREVNSVLTGR